MLAVQRALRHCQLVALRSMLEDDGPNGVFSPPFKVQQLLRRTHALLRIPSTFRMAQAGEEEVNRGSDELAPSFGRAVAL